jgi:hypothetical protein
VIYAAVSVLLTGRGVLGVTAVVVVVALVIVIVVIVRGMALVIVLMIGAVVVLVIGVIAVVVGMRPAAVTMSQGTGGRGRDGDARHQSEKLSPVHLPTPSPLQDQPRFPK